MCGRNKIKNRELVLSKKITFNVNDATLKMLTWIAANSGCRHIGTVASAILSDKRITIFHRDPNVMATLPDFKAVRAEIHDLGIEINRLTKSFNSTEAPRVQILLAVEVAEKYAKVGEKVDQLIAMVSQLQMTPIQGNRKGTLAEIFERRGIKF